MPLQKFPFKPGVYKDDSPLQAEGYWIDADKVRFVRGLPETIYGWERATTSVLLGICRGAITWADNSRNPYAAFGTSQRLYAMNIDGIVTDLTPVTARATQVSISFTTTASTTVTAAWTAHGLIALQQFTFDESTVATIGGITINGTYTVASVVDANTITYVANQTGSAAGPTSATLNTTVYLAPGQNDGIGGFGFGTGGYGVGGYASPSSGVTYFPRSWSLAAWGQNLLANPRGGGIYEWAPYSSGTELTTNGTFTGSATGWTLGSGWAYGTNNVVATNASTAIQQNITTPAGAWCLTGFDMSSWTTGSLQVSYAGTAIGSAASANGSFRVSFFTGAGGTGTLQLTGTNLSATLDNVSVQAETYANVVTNAPTVATGIFVTSERILVAYGVNDDLLSKFDGAFDAMRVAWTDQQNNQSWTPSTTNLAGSYKLSNGSRIIRGLPGFGVNILLTDTALYLMTYVPDPGVVYSFTDVATGCGLIGPNAVCQVLGRTFWMSGAGEFFEFDGTFPVPVQCTLRRDVMDNLAWVQQDKIYACANAAHSEVWWFYPDARDGIECSRYIIYNFAEQTWSCGTFDRTAMTDQGIFQYPLAIDAEGQPWFHEKGFSADGGQRSWFAKTSFIDIADGDKQARILGYVPDSANQQGNYTIQIDTQILNNSGVISRTFGPYNVMPTSGNVNFRANGQQCRFTYAGTSSPAFWRRGADRFEVQSSGRVK
jgi:hypothetical protein